MNDNPLKRARLQLLKDFHSISDAASIVSKVLDEDCTDIDLLELAIQEGLRFSINLYSPILVARYTLSKTAERKKYTYEWTKPDGTIYEDYIGHELASDPPMYLLPDLKLTRISGIWSVPKIELAKDMLVNQLIDLRQLPTAHRLHYKGIYFEGDGYWYEQVSPLPEIAHIPDSEHIGSYSLEEYCCGVQAFFGSNMAFPHDSVIGFRSEELIDFLTKILAGPNDQDNSDSLSPAKKQAIKNSERRMAERTKDRFILFLLGLLAKKSENLRSDKKLINTTQLKEQIDRYAQTMMDEHEIELSSVGLKRANLDNFIKSAKDLIDE